jgi:ribosome-associated protein
MSNVYWLERNATSNQQHLTNQQTLMSSSPSTALAALCVRTLDNLKGENIIALDLRNIDSSPADYFVICSANSDTHARALNDALARATVSVGERRPRTEGRDVGDWVLLDYFDVVVHIFRMEAREYYKLEKLWGDAPVLDLKQLEEKSKAAKTAKTTVSGTKAGEPKPAKKTAKAAPKAASKANAEKTSAEKVSTEKASTEKAGTKKSGTKTTSAATKTTVKKSPAKATASTAKKTVKTSVAEGSTAETKPKAPAKSSPKTSAKTSTKTSTKTATTSAKKASKGAA